MRKVFTLLFCLLAGPYRQAQYSGSKDVAVPSFHRAIATYSEKTREQTAGLFGPPFAPAAVPKPSALLVFTVGITGLVIQRKTARFKFGLPQKGIR